MFCLKLEEGLEVHLVGRKFSVCVSSLPFVMARTSGGTLVLRMCGSEWIGQFIYKDVIGAKAYLFFFLVGIIRGTKYFSEGAPMTSSH